MINNKPKGDFKYVKVLTLRELNNYITYFDDIFDTNEIESISRYLREYQERFS